MATRIPLKPVPPGPQAELLRQGWKRQTTIGEPRLSELVETYRSLGYEVHVVEHRVEGEGCGTCFEAGQAMGQVYGEIWLRRREGAAAEDDELF
jgi:hypothetical protein